jgi:hypothetical protein
MGSSDGVAIEIVYDTSGSMQQRVPDKEGKPTPKYVIASRALNAVLDRLQAVASTPRGPQPVLEVGMVVFQRDHATHAVRLRPFDRQPFRTWLDQHGKPQRGTPLGDAIRLAGMALLDSPVSRKHILVITDGINTQGPDPTTTIPTLKEEAARRGTGLAIHLIAFDVNAEVFNEVKKLGATVVGAGDEKQLNSQLDSILSKKILLEDEESDSPANKPKQN